MSIQSEISRISNNVNNSLDALAEQGVNVPANANSNDLPDLIRSAGNQFEAALNGKADLSEGVFFIKGASGTAGTWTGSHPDITAYYDGLMIAYKVGVAGASTTTLNINGLGAVKVVRNATTAVSTVYPVNSVVFLVYTVDSGTAYWKAHDYDANTYQRVYETSTNQEYAITTRYNTTDGSTYYAEYGRYTNGVTINPSTNTITASKFKGALVGNADTATKATQDASGNVITSTYETKANATAKYAELENKITNAGGNNVPDYIVSEAERVVKAVQATRTAKTLVFTSMSDAHLYVGNASHDKSLVSAKMGCAGIEEMRKRMHLDFVSYLGDYTWSSTTYTTEQVKKDITAFKEATDTTNTEIWCVGNHDVNYGSGRDRTMTADEIYAYIGANSDGTKPYEDIHRSYGYCDFDNQKVRVIYLNTCDVSDITPTAGSTATSEGMSINQIRWVAETALDFSDKEDASEWGVIVMGHHPLQYLIPTNRVLKILEAYKDGTEVVTTVTINNVTHTISYDFSNLDKRAEIICNVHGHSHNYASSKISSSSSITPWLWRFCIPNLGVGRENECATNPSADFANMYGHFDANGNPIYHYKVSGTAEETSFCVIAVDRKNKYIYAYHFGAGEDRTFNYAQGAVEVVYNITETLSNCSSSNNPTTITQNASATLTFTANSGYSLPDSVTVTGASHTWDKATGTLVLSNPTANVSISITAVATVTIDNLVKKAEAADSTAIYNGGLGYKNGYRLTSGGNFESASTNHTITGYIPFDPNNKSAIYVKGASLDRTDSSTRMYFFNDKSTLSIFLLSATETANNQNNFDVIFNVEVLGDNYFKLSRNTKNGADAMLYYGAADVKYFRISLKASGADLIISQGTPIEEDPNAPTEVNNLLPTSIDTDGSTFNGKGYKDGVYLSEGVVTNTTSARSVTGFMPISYGSNGAARGEQVIYLKNITAVPNDNYVRVAFYDANKTYIVQQASTYFKTEETDDGSAVSVYTVGSDGNISSIDVTGYTGYVNKTLGKSVAFFRLSVTGTNPFTSNSIITVNEPIE